MDRISENNMHENKVKTLIEIFDGCQIENVIAGLRLKPEKIIFIGYKSII